MKRAVLAGFLALLWTFPAYAYPGPDSVAVLANSNVPESVALADSYAAARDVPARQVCKLAMPQADDVSLVDFQDQILSPLVACVTGGGVFDRIEAIVVMRGVPLRVDIGISSGTSTISLAAGLAISQSRLVKGDGGAPPPLLGQEPGQAEN